MDETGLIWWCLLERTFVCSDAKAALGVKESKERLTVLTYANAAGKAQMQAHGNWEKRQTSSLKGY
jgi:hypothetical protein